MDQRGVPDPNWRASSSEPSRGSRRNQMSDEYSTRRKPIMLRALDSEEIERKVWSREPFFRSQDSQIRHDA